MAVYNPHSPRARAHALDSVTPFHSPHHSVHSSTSSRTPLHTLSLHEYRKQQNSPASHIATPPGKTLRRKAAAPALPKIERVASTSTSPSLHFSQSAHQLTSYQPLPPSPPHVSGHQYLADLPFRSQSAEPNSQGSIVSRDSASDAGKRVRNFKTIKRLPKPPAAPAVGIPPPPLANVTPPQRRLSPLRTTSFPSVETSNHSQTTPSTFSLSRFPQPPQFFDPPLSPPNAEHEQRLNTAAFTTAAPATPPATPAVIHYRGASFDLVNPHESLWFHDIETPSRDLDSTDYLPLRSSEDLLALPEMTPKRPLYGDLSSAYTSILTRHNGNNPHVDLPLPPTPTAHTPGSSQYTSPLHSSDSNLAVSPLALNKTENESRFSLKQLTRSLTRKLAKSTETSSGEELHNLSPSRVSHATPSFDGAFPRPLTQSYPVVTGSSTFPDDPPTPISPLDHAVNVMSMRGSDVSEYSRIYHRYHSAPLTSMVPDEPSTQVGRASDPRPSISDGDMHSKPYYDDIASLYPSSSVYTGDDHAQSHYAPSFTSNRRSNPFAPMGGDADALADEYKSDALYSYPDSRRTSHRVSRPLTQDMFRRSMQKKVNDQTDTISKFIDQYKQVDSTRSSQSLLQVESSGDIGLATSPSGAFEDPSMVEQRNAPRVSSGFSQFDFDIPQSPDTCGGEAVAPPVDGGFATRPMTAYTSGAPPPLAAPLAPAFEYDDIYEAPQRPVPSEMFSKVSSYGDTRQLLQLSQPMIPGHGQEPSSSYSQPEAPSTPQAPQEALDLAGEIFEGATTGPQEEVIPAMWARRNSGNLLRSKSQVNDTTVAQQEELDSSATEGDDEASEADGDDWETVGERSQPGRLSGRFSSDGSIADYSSSGGSSRDSLGFSSSELPVLEDEPLEPGSFQFRYQHPGPLPAHSNPFNSSPPQLTKRMSVYSAPNHGPPSSPVSSHLQSSSTVPTFHNRYNPAGNDTGSPQPTHTIVPWLNPLGLSDKETQEFLLSGPNEDILYEDDYDEVQEQEMGCSGIEGDTSPSRSDRAEPPTTSSFGAGYELERDNTFNKFTVVGPKGNLTGTPQGTGMNDAGSSVADNSSPGAYLSSGPPNTSPYDRSTRASYPIEYAQIRAVPSRTPSIRPGIPSFKLPIEGSSESSSSPSEPGFYASPGRKASVHRVTPGLSIPKPSEEQDRNPSQVTLFPRPVREGILRSEHSRRSRHSVRVPGRARRQSRAAVPGQTKLRHMVLAPDVQSLSSDRTSDISRLIRTADSGRPSTSHTHTPLRIQQSGSTLRTIVAYEHSPHLLCPERGVNPEEEEERRKLSWYIFALFCLLPPMLILYRWMGDFFIINITKGRLMQVSPKPKKIALGVGIAVNVGLSTAILLPILIAHAAGAL